MPTSNDAVVKALKEKVEKLIIAYRGALDENERLSETISALNIDIEKLSSERTQLKQELASKRFADSLVGEDHGGEAKKRIGQLVREIDKCIALLSN